VKEVGGRKYNLSLSVSLPAQCKKLGTEALSGVIINSINLEQIKCIGASALANSNISSNIDLQNCESIESGAFENSVIKELKAKRLEIAVMSFYRCRADEISIGKIYNGASSAFESSNIRKLNIGEVLGKSIAMTREAHIREVNIEYIGRIDGYAFEKVVMGEVNLECKEIGSGAFLSSNIKKLNIKGNVNILNNAFQEASIGELTIESIHSIESSAFLNATVGKLVIAGKSMKEFEGINVTG